MLARNYFLIRNSKNYVFAEQKEYLIGDGLLSKTWDFLNFIDDNTAWTQPRLRDREMHKQSGYKKNVNGADVELGMKSQILGVSLKDNPDKLRGKAGELVFFEEAGSFSGLLKAWEVAMPTMRQGSKTLGTMIAFGTNKRKGSDAKSYDQYIAEHPFTPQEATLQTTANLFDVASLKEQYNRVKTRDLDKSGITGYLYYKGSELSFRPSPDVRAITKFPHRKGDDIEGGVVVYEPPFRTKDNTTPANLYIIGHDPYAHGTSLSGESLGAAYVFKRPNNLSKPDDLIVASYVGRPKTQDEYNQNLMMLAEYYNAKIGFENDRGELIAYAKRFRKLHRLQEEFEMLDKKELRSRTVKRQYGMHMTEQRKRQGELYIRDWLVSPRSTNEDGETMLNLHTINDLALLEELIKFNHKGNFDRVMSFMVVMYHTRELYNKEVVEIVNDRALDDWFDNNYR